ncbi:hypothetical protein DPMN_032812 [Dreissena polymorpha]|uniref:Promethin n=2 Tax=Dreissena polymorpha TaxID=45954 RepID=A0A9D4M4U2_DREPO|nr:hypothetical protein DPMN_032812 [Dreissena polymorpha]
MSLMADTVASTPRECDHGEVEYHEEQNPFTEFCKFLYEHFHMADKWSEIKLFRVKHPICSVYLIVTLGLIAVPVATFMVFVVSSLIFTFLGFLFFEGTLLAIGTVILGFVLLFVGMCAIGVSCFLVGGFYALQFGRQFLVGLREKLHSVLNDGKGIEKEE